MTELKELSPAELDRRLHDCEDSLEQLRFQLDSGQLPNTARVRHLRRDIARIRTMIREFELGKRQPKEVTA
ncbi:50S ribosomal protein L29 [bacterium]|nr:50S ribosomal protein L29 [bacterium]MBU1984435.1 50S ribosomal protein L29 [bacterium]